MRPDSPVDGQGLSTLVRLFETVPDGYIPVNQKNPLEASSLIISLYVTENSRVKTGLTIENIGWAFTTTAAANWHPLTWVTHMLDVQLYGLNPGAHHLTNVLFHIANTLILFFIFYRATGALWESAFVAALFALHPLQVEGRRPLPVVPGRASGREAAVGPYGWR